MNPLAFAYSVDGAGVVRAAAGPAPSDLARINLDGLSQPFGSLRHFGTRSRDLLRVATAVLAADRLSPRQPAGAKEIHRELYWQRRLSLRVAVEDPGLWAAAVPELHALLGFLSDDDWDVSFDRSPPVPDQLPLLPDDPAGTTEVALFSGGLDSVAGLQVRHAIGAAQRFVAVSACGNEVRGRAQARAVEALRALGIDLGWARIVHQLCRLAGRPAESTQRTRGLLFLGLGAAVAGAVGVDRFSIYETGIGSINLPLSTGQVGSQGTRAMHPRTLALFNQLLARVLDVPVQAMLPFFFSTKGDLCRQVGADLDALVPLCSSCDEGEGHKPDPMEHCGLCSSCIFRRVSIHAARPGEDPTRYRDVPGRRHGQYELVAFEHHATELASVRDFADLVALDPDVRFALSAPTGSPLSPVAAKVALLQMYRRYAQQIGHFMESARPRLRPAPDPIPRKEEAGGDLFAAAG
jgi:7-cyano-7-deazaguanine synthase in queuosine biosynthesis